MLMPSIFRENLFDDFFDDFYRPAVKRTPQHEAKAMQAVMRTDVKETENSFELAIELPGFKKEDVKAELKDGTMTISAVSKHENEEKDANGRFIRRERYTGSCSRSFYVGEAVTEEDISAKFEDGILKVTVPKKEVKPAVEEKKYIPIA